jgi:hypothetical protein
MLSLLVGIVDVALIAATLFDALETMVVPQRVARRLPLSRILLVANVRVQICGRDAKVGVS